MYEQGTGVPRNLTEALRWYQLAAANGDPDARQAVRQLSRKTPAPAGTPQARSRRQGKAQPAQASQARPQAKGQPAQTKPQSKPQQPKPQKPQQKGQKN